MPLYYFDVSDDGQSFPDEWGIDLDTIDEARAQAQALLPHLAREGLPKDDRRELSVNVRSSEGPCRYRVTLTIQGEWIDPNRA